MTEISSRHDLEERLRHLDDEIDELRGIVRPVIPGEVRDPEEIANDLTSREEQQAVLTMLERRRQSIVERLRALAE